MGGACRESYRVWKRPFAWRSVLRWRTWRYASGRRLVFDDNLMPLVCAVIGHQPYNTSTMYEPPETACHRCHQWLRHLDPPLPPPVPDFTATIPLNPPILLADIKKFKTPDA